jgi:hypothetical protein
MMNSNMANYNPYQQGYASPTRAANTSTNSTSAYYDYDVSPTFRGQHQPHLSPPSQAPLYGAENPYTVYGNDGSFYEDPSFLGPWSSGGQAPTQDPPASISTHALAQSTQPGYYYPLAAPILPQWAPAPVTALAYDEAFAALYVASATLSNGRNPTTTRWKIQPDQPCYDRSSMLAVHSTNPVDNGMMFASVAGHPEASRNAMMDVYSCLYGFSGIPTSNGTINTNTTGIHSSHSSKPNSPKRPGHHAHHIPSHAYKPVYGRTNLSTPGMDLASAIAGGAFAVGKNTFHRGITTLLPLSGSVASVSPSAVRVHAHGGLQLADQALQGMLCGTIHPTTTQPQQSPSLITVGGILVNGTTTNQHHQAYCLDLWRGLQIVTSRTIQDSDHDPSSSTPLGITAMATSHKRGSIVAGCSDGKIRFLDASLREVAKIKAHAGGITDVCVSEDGMLIATTGYGYRPTGSTSLYAFPEPNIQLFDIRFLGKSFYIIIYSFANICQGSISYDFLFLPKAGVESHIHFRDLTVAPALSLLYHRSRMIRRPIASW